MKENRKVSHDLTHLGLDKLRELMDESLEQGRSSGGYTQGDISAAIDILTGFNNTPISPITPPQSPGSHFRTSDRYRQWVADNSPAMTDMNRQARKRGR